ncbi:hypothetical protein [Nocardia sp. NPDC005366]|uniref:hypothetical protein n=1 Tax=Nocardia sp. NPDC005366 TaxID=3156878 RepID=UPI0033A015D3
MNRISGARITAAVCALLAAMAVAGCGASDEGTGAAASSAAASSAAASSAAASPPTEDAGGNQGRLFTADPTIVGAHPIPFTSWTRISDDRIAVNFQSGAPECYGVDAAVTESAKTVVVELRSGTKADAVGRMCTMVAVFGTLEVPLKTSLGDRQVLSAA